AHAAKHVGRQQTAFSRSVQEASPTRLAPLCIPRRFCGSPERLRTKRNQNYSAPADQHWMALSLKPANFGRHANFIWTLHHLSSNARDLGALFIDFERLLTPPADRREPNGEPAEIASAMEAAIFAGFDNFLQFTS